MIADLESWLATSHSREASGTYDDWKLGPLQAVLSRLPLPPAPITVAGTKGKGSVIRLLEAGLLASGERCLCFTSPHVQDLHERWRLDGTVLGADQARAAALVVARAEAAAGIELTYFERCFALACVLAAADPQRHFLCEVGLGGRLDCANALDCRCAILTHLSYDHCELLGDSLAAIAREKCAVARPGRPLLIAPQDLATPADISAALPAGVTPHWIATTAWPREQPLALAGRHQRDNAATALSALRLLLPPDQDLAPARAAMSATRLAARCQDLSWQGHLLLIDAAHNAASLAATLAVATTTLPDTWRLILGLARDKDLDRMLPILPRDRLWRCGYAWPRARQRDDWPLALRPTPWFDDIGAALDALGPGQAACISGSFYLAGEALNRFAPTDLPG